MLGVLIAITTGGGEIASLSVEHHGGRFDIYSEVIIDLAADEVRAILTRYEGLADVTGGIDKVEILERRSSQGGAQVRMRIVSEVCLVLVCLDYVWVQHVETLPTGEIVAVVEPALSDFQEGRAVWRFMSEHRQRTRLVFDAYLVPDFWFPPVIGPWLIKRQLRNAVLETVRGVERVAAEERGGRAE
jgi:hypothetical protein